MIRTYQKLLNRLLLILDSLLMALSLFLAWYVKFHSGLFATEGRLDAKSYFSVLVFIIPLFLLFNYAFGLYSPKRAKSLRSELWNILKSLFFSGFFTTSGLFFIKQIDYSRTVLLASFVLTLLFISTERIVLRLTLRTIRAKGYNKKHILIIGAGDLGQRFLHTLREHPEFGYEAFGFLDDAHSQLRQQNQSIISNSSLLKNSLSNQSMDVDGVPILGTLDEYKDIIEQHHLDQVFIALPLSAHPRLGELIASSERMGVQTFIIPDYFGYLPAKPRFEQFGSIPLIDVRHVPLDDLINAGMKRTFDIVVSAIILLILLPLFIVIAIGVKLTSPGPVFFKQERMGKNRRTFYMYKFRSMKTQTDNGQHESRNHQDTGWTTPNDSRRTRFGSLLRAASLDELPQFYNVLKGEMSIIGPRPERPYFVDQFRETVPKYMIKHRVRPGITGWAQIHGWRGDTSIEERIKCDLFYIENWSFLLDLKIFLLTLLKGFVNRNAY